MKKRNLLGCTMAMLLLTVSMTACGTEEETTNSEAENEIYEYENTWVCEDLSVIKSEYSEDCFVLTFEGDALDSSIDVKCYDRHDNHIGEDYDIEWDDDTLTITGDDADDICGLYLSKTDGENFLYYDLKELKSDQFVDATMPIIEPIETLVYEYPETEVNANLSIISTTYWNGGFEIAYEGDGIDPTCTIQLYDADFNEIIVEDEYDTVIAWGYQNLSINLPNSMSVSGIKFTMDNEYIEIRYLDSDQFAAMDYVFESNLGYVGYGDAEAFYTEEELAEMQEVDDNNASQMEDAFAKIEGTWATVDGLHTFEFYEDGGYYVLIGVASDAQSGMYRNNYSIMNVSMENDIVDVTYDDGVTGATIEITIVSDNEIIVDGESYFAE